MTLGAILERAVQQVGEDSLTLADCGDLLRAYVNQGLAMLCGEREDSFAVYLLAGRIALTGLPREAVRVIRLADARGNELPFAIAGGELVSEGYVGGGTVTYAAPAQKLASDAEEAQLPEAFCMALADYASARLLGNGDPERQARGGFYMERFLAARAQYASMRAPRRLAGLYD